MRVLDFMRPAPHVAPLKDADDVNSQYNYWRWRIFFSMYFAYIFYYLTRKSLTFAMPALMQDLNLQISDLGILSSILSLTYGISKFLSGVLSDRSNPRFFMAVGLIITGIANICFGLSSSIFAFAIFWAINGWFQGWGWPPCARLLTHWYSKKERGRWWGMWNTSHSVGGAIIPLLAAFCAQSFGWRYALYVPGVLCIVMGLFLMERLRDTPQSLGLPAIEKFKNDFSGEPSASELELSTRQILWQCVLKNRYIWLLGASYFFVYFVRQAINDYGALFLINTKGYSLLSANGSVFWFEVGGILGSICAGWASDKLFSGMRGPVNALFCVGMIFGVSALYWMPGSSCLVDFALMFLVGFLVFGPQMLIGVAAAELSHKKAAGTATGFIGWLAYLGAATAGYPITKVAEKWGWGGFFAVLTGSSCVAFLLLLPLWKAKKASLS